MDSNKQKIYVAVLASLVMSISLPPAWSGEAIMDCEFIERPQTTGQESDRPKRKVVINKLDAAPVIDGDLKDSIWQKAAVLDDFERGKVGAMQRATAKSANGNPAEFLASELKPVAGTETKGYVFYTDTHLYFGLECFEPQMDKIRVNAAANNAGKRDSSVWQDDDLEIFLNPGNDGINVYQFGFNAAGVIYDGYNKHDPQTGKIKEDRNWNCEVQAATRRAGKSWTLEAAVPLSALANFDLTGTAFGFNVQRQRTPGSIGHGDLQFWAPSDESAYSELKNYGILIFSKEPEVELLSFGISRPKFGKNSMSVRARNQGDQNVDLDCEAEFISGKSPAVKVQGKINCPAKKESKVEFPCELAQTGQWLFKGTVKQGDRIIASRQESFVLPETLLEIRLANSIYYANDKLAKAALNFNITPASLPEMQIEVMVKNEKGIIHRSKVTKIRSGEARLYINLSDLAAGKYGLQVDLLDSNGKIIATATKDLIKELGPFESL